MSSFLTKLIRIGRNACFIVCLLTFFSFCTYSQNQNLADSLEFLYMEGFVPAKDKMKVLHELAVNYTDPEKKLAYSEELIQSAIAIDSEIDLLHGYLEKGNALRLKGDLSLALENYFLGARVASEEDMNQELGKMYIPIADIYSISGNHDNAIKYYMNAVSILRDVKDSINLATALINAGDEYLKYNQPDSALMLFTESGVIFNALDYNIGVAYNLGNTGLVYAQMGDNSRAEYNINEAVSLLRELGDYPPICEYLIQMSDIYLEKGDEEKAFEYANRSLQLAQQNGLKEQIRDANLKLSELYNKAGDTKEAFDYYKNYVSYRDSVINLESVQVIADLGTDFEVSRKQLEVDLLNQQKKNQQFVVIGTLGALLFLTIFAIGIYRRYQFTRKTNSIIEEEKNRSENLLLNILPAGTAKELKQSGKVQAKRFDSVSIMFADFQSFTQHAENLPPEKLVERVDFYFSKFDEIIEKHDIEKIKTIGDAYMCAGGLPFQTKNHALQTTTAAMEMLDFVKEARKSGPKDQIYFDVRIGINTGPVVAGVVGTKKFAYDIWGDSVNIASRLESNSEQGRINVSEHTYALIKDQFDCEYRGEIEVKNRGSMKMYFINKKKATQIDKGHASGKTVIDVPVA